ncbi:MAG: hypothetical protein WC489_09250 [Patescibacteria group bacterium]
MTFTPKEVILGATLPLENGSTVTFSIAGHVEAERDYDDAVVIFSRKLLKYTNCATDADRLTARQVVASITSTPLDKVPDVGTPTSPAPVKEPAKVAPPVAAPTPGMGPAPTAAEQAAAAVAQCIKPPTAAPEPAPSAPPEGFSLCAECGEAVPANQAKLSQLFASKTLCKSCLDGRRS